METRVQSIAQLLARASGLHPEGHRFEPGTIYWWSCFGALPVAPPFTGWGERINHTVSPSFGAGWREAHLAELADALDLGSSAFGRVGSTPTMRTLLSEESPIPGGVRSPGQ